MSKRIIYKTPEQIDNIRESGKYLTELLLLTQSHAKPWVSGIELEEIAQAFMDKYNIVGAFKWYEWFPANLCLSVNNCVVHGIPDKTILKPGDLLKIDAGVTYKAWISDAAVSLVVWGKKINKKADHLISSTKWALDHGLSVVKPWHSLFKYGKAVQEYLTKRKCSVIKNLTGHGVGIEVHEWPAIYNRPNGDMQQYTFEKNMVVALEPITAIKSNVYVEKKWVDWNLYTKKGDLWAQREYTLVITDSGYEILAGVVHPDWI